MATYMKFGPLYPNQHVKDWYYDDHHNASNITSGCPNGTQWIYHFIGDCVVTPMEVVSSYLGMISVLTWMGVGIPQIIKNFRNIDGMAGVSFFLLFQWTGGDATNLVGSILTKQLVFQIVLAVWFVFTDAVLLLQYFMFWKRNRSRRKALEGEAAAARIGQTPQLILCFMGLFAMSFFPTWSSSDASSGYNQAGRHLSRSLLSAQDENALIFTPENHVIDNMVNKHTVQSSGSFWHNTTDIVGYAIGIVSAIFYLGSRSSQIYKNYKRKSTEGLAILMFIMAVFGNITYGGQIIFRSLDGEFLLEKAPWIVGSLGVIGLDVTLLCQFRYYDRKKNLDGSREALLNINVDVP